MKLSGLFAAAILMFATLAIAGCASGPKTVVDYDSSIAFSDYETFAWAGDDPVNTDGVNRNVSALMKRQISDAVAADLEQKGYRQVEEAADADFLVMVTLGRRDQFEIDTFTENQYAYMPRGSRVTAYAPGVYGYGYKTTGQTVEQYTEGSISIDIFDNSVGQPVWFGSVSEEVDSFMHPEEVRQMLLQAIPLVLDKFPPDAA